MTPPPARSPIGAYIAFAFAGAFALGSFVMFVMAALLRQYREITIPVVLLLGATAVALGSVGAWMLRRRPSVSSRHQATGSPVEELEEPAMTPMVAERLAEPSVVPPVWNWYRAYAGLMALLYLGLLAMGAVVSLMPGRADQAPPWLTGVFFGCVGLPLAGAFVAAFFVPRRPWAWIYHLVLICIGMTSACCLPICIPLLIFWIKPEAKRYFGRG